MVAKALVAPSPQAAKRASGGRAALWWWAMNLHTEAIGAALAPGIALNSVIFYNTSLQNRFTYIAGRIRELNREARELRAGGSDEGEERLRSIKLQVDLMSRRSRIVQRSILIAYFALAALIMTILGLLVAVVSGLEQLFVGPLVTFGGGLCALAVSVFLSWSESRVSAQTLIEDIRSSHLPPAPPGPGEASPP